MKPDDYVPDEDLLRRLGPSIAQYLAKYEPPLAAEVWAAVAKRTMITLLAVRRKATKQRLDWTAFARRVAGEQVLVWLAQRGTPTQQAYAHTQVMARNQEGVARYLRGHFRFRTTDVAEEVISDTFSAFFDQLTRQQPVLALLLTCLIGIARNKALHQLRHERTAGQRLVGWLETTFVHVDDANAGAFEWPLLPTTEPDDDQLYPLPDPTNNPTNVVTGVPMAQLRQWIVQCLAQLPPKRRELVQRKHHYLTNADLGTWSIEQLEGFYNTDSMSEIAEAVGYSGPHIASVRLTETHNALRDCIQQKRQRL